MPQRRIDITNHRFGMLQATTFGGASIGWKCICDCGGETFQQSSDLRSGRVTSCGCNRGKTKPMLNKRFGKWLVTGEGSTAANGVVRWKAVCDCGTTREVEGPALRKGTSKSCGCDHSNRRGSGHLTLTGQRFGRLLVGEKTRAGSNNRSAYNCMCDCGKSVVVPTTGLTGGTKSCGCLRSESKGRPRLQLHAARSGRLVVEGEAHFLDKTPGWACICDCGNRTIIKTTELASGRAKSCGCAAWNSVAEEELFTWILTLAPDAQRNVSIGDSRLRWDVVIPSAKLVVEYNGVIWHSTKYRESPSYHLDKRLAAEAAGYRQIIIWEDEFEASRDRFRALLTDAITRQEKRVIGARHTTVVTLDSKVANEWHHMYHVQLGMARGPVHLGLEHKSELIAVVSIHGATITRYSVKHGVSIPGGLRKLIAAANLKRAVTYCDRDHFTGALYRNAGFKMTGTTLQLTYTDGGKPRTRREVYMRHKLVDLGIPVAEGQTEKSALEAAGVYQCWNSGVDRYEL